MVSMAFIDSFNDGGHGEEVKDTAQLHFDGPTANYDVDLDSSSGVWAEKIRQAVDDGHDVINMSISTPDIFGSTINPFELDNYSEGSGLDDLGDAYNYARDNGVSVFTAAGNNGSFDGTLDTGDQNALVVGATDFVDEREDYSQGHPNISQMWGLGHSADGAREGTSFATPRVSGAFAEAMDRHNLNLPETMTAYEQTGESIRHFDQADSYQHVLRADDLIANGKEAIQKDEIIDGAYRAFLGRHPDADGSSWWADNGTVEGLVDAVEGGDDWNQDQASVPSRIKALYNVGLHRDPDMDGFNYWLDKAASFDTWQQLTQAFKDGAEAAGQDIQHDQAFADFLGAPGQDIGDAIA